MRLYKGEGFVGCATRSDCTRSKNGIRQIKDFSYQAERDAIKAKMKTPRAKELYMLRSQTVEPAFGDIKENKGFRSFLTRGIETVKAEFHLACIVGNLCKIMKHFKGSGKKTPQGNRLKRIYLNKRSAKGMALECPA